MPISRPEKWDHLKGRVFHIPRVVSQVCRKKKIPVSKLKDGREDSKMASAVTDNPHDFSQVSDC